MKIRDFGDAGRGFGRFTGLTGAPPRPYTPRFAYTRRLLTTDSKESFKNYAES